MTFVWFELWTVLKSIGFKQSSAAGCVSSAESSREMTHAMSHQNNKGDRCVNWLRERLLIRTKWRFVTRKHNDPVYNSIKICFYGKLQHGS